jgi:general secretion pathway protein G
MRRTTTGGFTLVEMMVVIVIIGILATVLITQIAGKADKARVEATRAMIAQVSGACDLFNLDHSRYPDNLMDLMRMPPYVDGKKWPPAGYLKKEPKDAWDRPFIYRVPGTNGQPYDIISLGADGREGGQVYDEDLWNHEAYKR